MNVYSFLRKQISKRKLIYCHNLHETKCFFKRLYNLSLILEKCFNQACVYSSQPFIVLMSKLELKFKVNFEIL